MGGAQNGLETDNIEIVWQSPQALYIFSQVGWLAFLEHFQGSNVAIATEFAQIFDGEVSTFQGVTFQVKEKSISKAARLRIEGYRWTKHCKLPEDSWTKFVSIPFQISKVWRKGFQRKLSRKPWRNIALIVHKFITCEGHFSVIMHYHIRILLHLKQENALNPPFFLTLKDLNRMAKTYQRRAQASRVFHVGFIKGFSCRVYNSLV